MFQRPVILASVTETVTDARGDLVSKADNCAAVSRGSVRNFHSMKVLVGKDKVDSFLCEFEGYVLADIERMIGLLSPLVMIIGVQQNEVAGLDTLKDFIEVEVEDVLVAMVGNDPCVAVVQMDVVDADDTDIAVLQYKD